MPRNGLTKSQICRCRSRGAPGTGEAKGRANRGSGKGCPLRWAARITNVISDTSRRVGSSLPRTARQRWKTRCSPRGPVDAAIVWLKYAGARSPPEGRPSASRRRLLLQPTNGAAMEEPAPVPRVVHTAADDGSEGAKANTGYAAVAPCGGRQCARAHVVHSCATGGGGGGRHHAKKRAELGRGEQDSRRGPLRCGASHVRLLPRLGTADEILLQCLRQANL